jgi:hypothetical protein
LRGNGNNVFPLHPTLAALPIVLKNDEDLGSITRSHPGLGGHKFYDKNAAFPDDLSSKLPPIADRWWEHLGMDLLVKFPCCPAYLFFNEKLKTLAERMLPESVPQFLALLFRTQIRVGASS